MEISIELIFMLFGISLIAGTIDTMVGGGGLITIPALMLSGLSPINALGTNKLQGFVGTGTATFILFKKSKIRLRHIRPLAIGAFVGSMIGTIAVHFVSQKSLSLIIPIVLIFIAGYFSLYRPNGNSNLRTKISASKFKYAVIPGIGFYDGMFGPGTGSFFTLSSVMLRNAKIVAATATAKPLNFATNISSFIVYALYGNVVWKVGMAMMLGQLVGAQLGVHFLYKVDPNKLRFLIILTCVVMLAKYLASSEWMNT